jgi:hypothetical protein
MKATVKLTITLAVSAFVFTAINAQEVAMINPGNAGEEAKAPAANTEMQVTLKNTAATNIYVFAGHKEEIRTPRVETYGGYSKNTLYVQANDVVCLMTAEVKPMACTVIKPGTSMVEVNPSGNGISSK